MSIFETNIVIALVALAVEAAVGYPNAVFRWVRHPVVWIGHLIAMLERTWNRAEFRARSRRWLGGLLVVTVLFIVAAATVPLAIYLRSHPWGWVAEAMIATTLISQRSLYDHVAAVLHALFAGDISQARIAVAKIIGRDTDVLDQTGIARAGIESLAENFSDGVVAPMFWLFVGGLPGIALYKTINTADSMIGHRSERYLDFGQTAAQLDDLVNIVPARLSALSITCAALFHPGSRPRSAFGVAIRDAPSHVSPNAGWPEAATAGALNIRLGGPRKYADQEIAGAWLGKEGADATAEDIARALKLIVYADILLGLLLALVLIGVFMINIH